MSRSAGGVEVVLASGRRATFDQVVLACHADEALALLAEPLPSERQILSRFAYQANRASLHTDERLMPKSRFHEDALRASVELAERFGVRAPWLSGSEAALAQAAQ